MATTVYVPVEQYLHSAFEPDAEYVDGEIQERPMGELDHAAWQAAILEFFLLRRREWNIRAFPELRVQVSPTRFRVPDVTVLKNTAPLAEMSKIVVNPPLAVFEILSPEDTLSRTLVRLTDYETMGVPAILVVDPQSATFRYEHGSLERLEDKVFEMPGSTFIVDMSEIEKLLG